MLHLDACWVSDNEHILDLILFEDRVLRLTVGNLQNYLFELELLYLLHFVISLRSRSVLCLSIMLILLSDLRERCERSRRVLPHKEPPIYAHPSHAQLSNHSLKTKKEIDSTEFSL